MALEDSAGSVAARRRKLDPINTITSTREGESAAVLDLRTCTYIPRRCRIERRFDRECLGVAINKDARGVNRFSEFKRWSRNETSGLKPHAGR